MRFLTLLIFAALSIQCLGQKGNYFLSHYAPGTKSADNVCFDMVQDGRGMMYFATKAGVLEFDGRNWELLKSPTAIFSLQTGSDGEIYWGGANGFGKIGYNEDGFQTLHSLRDSTDSEVLQSYVVNNVIYFLTEETLYAYDHSSEEISVIPGSKSQTFTRIFELCGSVFVQTQNSKLLKVSDDKLVPSDFSLPGDMVFSSKIDDVYVIGTSDNKIYTCNQSLNLTPVKVQDQEYVNGSVIVAGSWVNRQLLAIGTLRGGVVFINPITGKTEQIVNHKTGLPDNEVFASLSDQNQNVWVAHDYGFTRISPHMPFRSFNYYPGLEGNLLCSYASGTSVYVGTTVGLFKLQKEDVYDELDYFIDVEITGKKSDPIKSSTKSSTIEEDKEDVPASSTESKKRGLFGFLKRNRNKQKEEPTQTQAAPSQSESSNATTAVNPPSAPRYRKEKRTKRILRESQYVYKKVNGIDAKVTHLVESKHGLIASGLAGVFKVDGIEASQLLSEPIYYLYSSTNEDMIFASTYDDNVRSLVFESGKWQQVDFLDAVNDHVNFMFEGENRELWICGVQNIYQYEITDYNFHPISTIRLANSDAEKTIGINLNGRIIFANTEGFFQYDKSSKNILKIDSLMPALKYFAHKGSMIYRDVHGWNVLGNPTANANIKLLNLFNDLRFITADRPDNNLWVISGSNELYRLFSEKMIGTSDAFPLYLKSVTNDNVKTSSQSELEIVENKNAVRFDIVQADYVSPEATEFRYQLQGMNEEWSDWSNNHNQVLFPYLPPGNYTLLVQSKNIFGKLTDLKPYSFEVLAPYWKRPWFYALEFAFLTSLVFLSFRLNARYRIVSRILSLLAIILLIQFLQTVIDSGIKFDEESPVIHFIIQVFVALLILPVEGYLRNLMFRSLDAKSKFYSFISPRAEETSLPDSPEDTVHEAPNKKEAEDLLSTDKNA
jgi:hypothetical protein